MDDVILGDIAQFQPISIEAGVETVPVKKNISFGGDGIAVQRFELRGLARATWPHQRDHFSRKYSQVYSFEQPVVTFAASEDAKPIDLDGDVALVIAPVNFAFIRHFQRDAAQTYYLSGTKQARASDALAVDKCSVQRLEIANFNAVRRAGQLGEPPGNGRKRQREIAFRIAARNAAFLDDPHFLVRLRAYRQRLIV